MDKFCSLIVYSVDIAGLKVYLCIYGMGIKRILFKSVIDKHGQTVKLKISILVVVHYSSVHFCISR